MKTKILLAEDDKNLGDVLTSYLTAKGFPTVLCGNGREAFERFRNEPFDFCIIDVMMPVMDGFTLAQEIRKTDKKIPILFLTARSMEEDKLKGFSIGADDYLTKPFSMEELLARIQAILRRATPPNPREASAQKYIIGKLSFDYNRQLLTGPDGEQKLTSKESELLKMLCDNVNQTLDRSIALKKIWGDDSYFNARSMDVYITKLRKYLRADPNIELINVHGIGFKLVVTK
ncbi:MAG: response regulator transcription factor [Bacteroidales bacterium]